ncbi:MAG: hypothetical protein ACKOEO_21425 [Planctomycetaceae bacterium]
MPRLIHRKFALIDHWSAELRRQQEAGSKGVCFPLYLAMAVEFAVTVHSVVSFEE